MWLSVSSRRRRLTLHRELENEYAVLADSYARHAAKNENSTKIYFALAQYADHTQLFSKVCGQACPRKVTPSSLAAAPARPSSCPLRPHLRQSALFAQVCCGFDLPERATSRPDGQLLEGKDCRVGTRHCGFVLPASLTTAQIEIYRSPVRAIIALFVMVTATGAFAYYAQDLVLRIIAFVRGEWWIWFLAATVRTLPSSYPPSPSMSMLSPHTTVIEWRRPYMQGWGFVKSVDTCRLGAPCRARCAGCSSSAPPLTRPVSYSWYFLLSGVCISGYLLYCCVGIFVRYYPWRANVRVRPIDGPRAYFLQPKQPPVWHGRFHHRCCKYVTTQAIYHHANPNFHCPLASPPPQVSSSRIRLLG